MAVRARQETDDRSVPSGGSALPLIRPQALLRDAEVFAEVSVLAPLSLQAAVLTAAAAAGLLLLAAILIQVPDRVPATGLLMPKGGLVRVQAPVAAAVAALHVAAGDTVSAGQPLAGLLRDVAAPGFASLAAARRRTLDAEIELLEATDRNRQSLRQRRRDGLVRERAHLDRSRRRALERLRGLTEAAGLAARETGRLAALAGRGAVAAQQLERARGAWLEAENARLDAAAELGQLERNAERLAEEFAAAETEDEIRRLEIRARALALDRRRAEAAAEGLVELCAPVDGRVLRLAVEPGDSLSPGAAVMLLLPAADTLEARLYVPASGAARLEIGQTVELMLDAAPHQRYGTVAATVTAVGDVALQPADLKATIAVREAVFELRASLPADLGADFVPGLLPGIGASFRADILRRRLSLFEWLLRAVRDDRARRGTVQALRVRPS